MLKADMLPALADVLKVSISDFFTIEISEIEHTSEGVS